RTGTKPGACPIIRVTAERIGHSAGRRSRPCDCGIGSDDARMSQCRRAQRIIGAGSSGGRRPPSRTRGRWTESPRCRNIVLRRAARLLCVRCGGNLPVWRGSRPALPRTRRADRRYPDTAVSTGLRIRWGTIRLAGFTDPYRPLRAHLAARLNNRIRYEATMSLLYLLARWLDRISPAPIAYAHC